MSIVGKAMQDAREVMNRAGKVIEQLSDEVKSLRNALEEVRDLIDGYVDVKDGAYGQPIPNNAMKAVGLIDEALAKRPK